MQKRYVGKTGIAVSVIGLGTVKFGRNQGVKYPAAFALPSDQALKELISYAKESGINLLDTAPAYGASEERIGKLLFKSRHDWVISTKVGEEFIDGISQYDFSKQATIKSVENSLQKLKTDYLDIVLVHSNGNDQRIIEEENIFDTLAKLKDQGKIRAYGMSTKTITGGLLTVDYADIAMVTYNVNETQDQEIIAYAQQKQKGIFIKKAFASGYLTSSISENMRRVFEQSGVTSIIIGTINTKHLKENVTQACEWL